MVDAQRLELEKKRYRRESLSLGVALLALAVSAVATFFAVQPVVQEPQRKTDATAAYLTALSKPGINDALGGLAFAESDSPAATFANAVSRWRQALASEGPDAGTVTRGEDNTYKLCLPKLSVPLFPTECVTVANIEYSDDDDVLGFTLDGVPAETLVRTVTNDDLTGDGKGPVRIYLDLAVVAPAGTSETLVYTVNRRREPDRMYPVTFSSVVFQDDEEEAVTALATHFPNKLGYWQSATAVTQVPRTTTFMLVCWGGVQDERGGCDWVIGMGFR